MVATTTAGMMERSRDQMNIVWAALIVVAAAAVAVAVDARGAAPGAGGQLLRRQRPGRRHLRCPRHGVLGAARVPDLPRLRELRRVAVGSGDRGADRRPADPDGPGLPAEVGAELTGELVCYARSVIHGEWDRMEDGSLGEDINPWGVAMFRTLQGVELGYARTGGRLRQVAGPDVDPGGGPPGPHPRRRRGDARRRCGSRCSSSRRSCWCYLLGFADSGERAWVQAMFMGSVVAVIITMLLLLNFLDDPFHGGVGGLQPVAMERTELLIDQQLDVIGGDVTIPCDDAGVPA